MYQIKQIPDANGTVEYQKIETVFVYDKTARMFRSSYFNPIVRYLARAEWIGSEKVNGANSSVYWDGHTIQFFGRTGTDFIEGQKEALERTFGGMEVAFEQAFGSKQVRLFMECYGGKICREEGGAGRYRNNPALIGFDVQINGIYLDRSAIRQIFSSFGISAVGMKPYTSLEEAIREVQWMADAKKESPLNEEGFHTEQEGLVLLPKIRLFDHQYNRIAVKVKCEDMRKTLWDGEVGP